jgi:hypothetical protein
MVAVPSVLPVVVSVNVTVPPGALVPESSLRGRIENLLERIDRGCAAEQLQALRALQVLEWMGTPEAKQFLEKLARGSEGARLTREAQAALARLGPKTSPVRN